MRVAYTVAKSFELNNTDAAFLSAAVAVVAERGTDYVYHSAEFEGCVNVCKRDGEFTPACLIGSILVHMGVDPEWFEAENIVRSAADKVMGMLGFSDVIIGAALAAQERQDKGSNWGVALTEMVKVYAEKSTEKLTNDYDNDDHHVNDSVW